MTAPEAQKTRGWWSIQLKAPFWFAVSILLLVLGLAVIDSGEAKGRIALIAVGAFGVLCSLVAMALKGRGPEPRE